MRIGGPVIGILLGLSILALAVILLKLWQFVWSRLPAQVFIDRALEHWRAGRAQEALATLADVRNPAGEVLMVAITIIGILRGWTHLQWGAFALC